MAHAVPVEAQQTFSDLTLLLRTPLRQLTPDQVRPLVRRIVEDRNRSEAVDVAAFNSAI
ncbi:hypothetical protein [Micromonospora cremea]|uniref:FXSXX-COOH protein n=1 Tax=Micromonospora cremea TaxID=709881 RepID=A0A1N5TRQ8_9ACTN|nr:hypothetical protein [Micromonospora cremea]SIM51024.1 hypothetical protein SAMN04489832_0332 [Micromonospora cremea]